MREFMPDDDPQGTRGPQHGGRIHTEDLLVSLAERDAPFGQNEPVQLPVVILVRHEEDTYRIDRLEAQLSCYAFGGCNEKDFDLVGHLLDPRVIQYDIGPRCRPF